MQRFCQKLRSKTNIFFLIASASTRSTENDWKEVTSPKRKRPNLNKQENNINENITIGNRFQPIESENMDIAEASSASPSTILTEKIKDSKKAIKPPPINTHDIDIKKLIDVLKNSNIDHKSYHLKNDNDNNHIIYTSSIENYNSIKEGLKKK